MIAPIIKTIDKGTLKLTYNAKKKESLLSGTQKISVTAGSDIWISDLSVGVIKQGAQVADASGTQHSFTGVQNTKKDTFIIPVSQGPGQLSLWVPNILVWKVKAGQTAIFDVSISANPQNMLSAGAYTIHLLSDSFVYGNGYATTSAPFSSIDSNSVSVVGGN